MNNIPVALRSLVEQWQRAVLSALGVLVASVAIVLLVSIAKGVQKDLKDQVNDLGINLLIVLPGRIQDGSMFNPGLLGVSYLELADVERVRRVNGVRNATPFSFVGGGVKIGDKSSPSTLVVATGSEWFQMRKFKLREGRVLNPNDDMQPVCVIGGVTKEKLFGDEAGVGKTVTHGGRPYKVVGVTADEKSESSLFSQGGLENVMYVPYRYITSVLPQTQINRIMIQTRPDIEPKALKARIDHTLGQRLNRENYSVLTQEDLLKLVFQLMDILTWLLIGLTSIALFVGGVGIMAVMLMSVNERIKEIGIRKTVGARRKDIFVQFLTEATAISFGGGIVGLAFSYVVCSALRVFTPIKPLLSLDVALLAIGVCTAVGTVFGLIPAVKASSKQPVAAMRSE